MSEITDPTPELEAMAQAMSDAELIDAYDRFKSGDPLVPMQEAIMIEINRRELKI